MRLDFCVACGAHDALHHHHLLPRTEGGVDDDTNLITLCEGCHGRIHGRTFKHHRKLHTISNGQGEGRG
jgi:5-methylcytosine-specific restriction endonuclease McrA